MSDNDKSVPMIQKTFREKASWAAIILSFFRWYAFQAIMFHALFLGAWDIVAEDGVNILGIVNVDPFEVRPRVISLWPLRWNLFVYPFLTSTCSFF